MVKLNCWEFTGCERQPGGKKTGELGTCPAATMTKAHGINNGVNAGRACWVISGSLCGGAIQGSYVEKLGGCLKCSFFNQVHQEEGSRFINSREIMKILRQVAAPA
ncbi:MAG: two-CW domain-containing protein [Desulfobulbaceae bacterium]